MSLTERQSELLKIIIEEYIDSAEPIASVELVQKRQLPISGATVRNIMSDLVRKGYLRMKHVSSGRLPTELAYRYYISQLMSEPELSVIEEVALKQSIWAHRYELERLLCAATQSLSENTNALGIALTEDGYMVHAGGSRILDDNEFLEIEVAKAVFKLVDDFELAKSVFEKVPNSEGVSVLIGREIGLAHMEPVSLIFIKKRISDKDCYLGVLGPARANYSKVIAVIGYMSQLLNEISDIVD